MKKLFRKRNLLRLLEYSMITAGAIIAAFAIEEFLVPNTILDGGIVGISIIINNLTKIRLGLLTFVLNLPFLLIGMKKMGRGFILRSAYAMVVFSAFLEVFADLKQVTEETLLAVCFGGLILGIGVGLVIKFGGCLDGTETVAILLNRRFDFPVGQIILIFNVIIYGVAGILFGLDRAMYSLLTYFITSKILDIIEGGIIQTKAAMIITDCEAEISEKIYTELGRTVTIIEGAGLMSGRKTILYCVLTQFEIMELKRIVHSVDGSAFVTISDVSEIIGKHIKKKETD
ncbi:MAG: YitT family protein [Clostridia bacterium]|nr:YitT family protein [Clostridia bacterium]MBQ3897607.1 YitT family protein [Clostridia bacterium]